MSRNQINSASVMTMDMDSTSHVQHGEKMKGLDYDYKGNWCLSSLSCSDEFGFSHAMELRSGNTFSSVGAKFTITAHSKMGWEQKAKSLVDWAE